MNYFGSILTNMCPIQRLISMWIWSIYNFSLSIKSQNILLNSFKSNRFSRRWIDLHCLRMMFDLFQVRVYVEIISVVQHLDHHPELHESKHPTVLICLHQHFQSLQLCFQTKRIESKIKIEVKSSLSLPHFHKIFLINMSTNEKFLNWSCSIVGWWSFFS